jgi:uncharacterized protein with FMN-binding domain
MIRKYSVIIKVVDRNTLLPVPATISLNTHVTPQPTIEATFTEVPEGTYTITATARGYTTHTEQITIKRNEIVTVKLTPKAYLLSSSNPNRGCPTCPQ